MPQRRGALPITDAGVLDCADAYARGVPFDRLERLRAKTPVVWLDGRMADRPGSWAVLRYADVRHALTRPELFAPPGDGDPHGPSPLPAGLPDAGIPDAGTAPGQADPEPIDMDPPTRAMLARVPFGETVDFAGDVLSEFPETLRNTLAGGLYALLRHPAQYVRLREARWDEGLLDGAVEEMLRWWTPVLQVWRVVQRDTVVGGVPLLAGERVTLWLVSANHDDDVFPDPGRFLPDRFAGGAVSHLSFGFGFRACLGARLTRVQLRALLDALLERPGLPQLAGEPEMLRSNARHGFEHLPVRWSL